MRSSPTRRTGPRERASTPSGERSTLLTVEGDLISRCEIFDEADLDAALARFDELDRPVPLLENAATRTWAHLADAFNRRDINGAVFLTATDGRYEDRRKGLRDQGTARDVWQTVFNAPKSWRLEMEPVAIRGSRLGRPAGGSAIPATPTDRSQSNTSR